LLIAPGFTDDAAKINAAQITTQNGCSKMQRRFVKKGSYTRKGKLDLRGRALEYQMRNDSWCENPNPAIGREGRAEVYET
jgi:flagellar basal body rod protein FlgF